MNEKDIVKIIKRELVKMFEGHWIGPHFEHYTKQRAVPKVLTADEWCNSTYGYLNNGLRNGQHLTGAFKAGDKNGQLKRDLVYEELREACEYASQDGVWLTEFKERIREALKNIKPLE